jgi:hypothetical protein
MINPVSFAGRRSGEADCAIYGYYHWTPVSRNCHNQVSVRQSQAPSGDGSPSGGATQLLIAGWVELPGLAYLHD